MRLSLELKALTTHPRRCRSDVTVAKIMARILSKYAVSSCLQVIHSADARSFDEGQPSRPAASVTSVKTPFPSLRKRRLRNLGESFFRVATLAPFVKKMSGRPPPLDRKSTRLNSSHLG